MIKEFKVKNFKNFRDELILNLDSKKYAFNDHLIHNGIVRASLVLGKNASGKSNLGIAMMDIVATLTDKMPGKISAYANLSNSSNPVEFTYTFDFDGDSLVYSFIKNNQALLLREELSINNQVLIKYNHLSNMGKSYLLNTESLEFHQGSRDTGSLSFVKYLFNNSVLSNEDHFTNIFIKFMNFVDRMLLFYSIGTNYFIGYTSDKEKLSDAIVNAEKVEELESFLRGLGIDYTLTSNIIDGEGIIFAKYVNDDSTESIANLFTISSIGTKALILYFYWWVIKANEASFIFMDEFDAFYHFELASQIAKLSISRTNTQVIFTSHNTSLIDSDLFRPDCLYIINNSIIKSFYELTDKELRQAHNLEKMYRAGKFWFNE